MVEYLNRVVDTFHEYFGEVSEEAIKENFVTIYQVETFFSRCCTGAPAHMRRACRRCRCTPMQLGGGTAVAAGGGGGPACFFFCGGGGGWVMRKCGVGHRLFAGSPRGGG